MSARALALRGSLRSLSADRRAAIAFALPAAALLVVLILYPLVYGIALSLQRITATLSDGFVGLRNYSGILSDGGFWHSVLVTAEFSVAALVIEFGLGLGLALMLARVVRGGGVIRTLILIPTMLTPAVAATNFRMMLNYDVGIINYVIGLLGFAAHPWVSDPNTALIALVLTDIWRNTPFFALVLGAGLLALSPETLEAAELDGANGWQKLVFVKIPMLAPLILVALLFRIIDLFRTFDIVYVLTQGGPGNTTEVSSLHIYNDMYVGFFTSYAAAEATVFVLLTLVVSVFVIRVLRLHRV